MKKKKVAYIPVEIEYEKDEDLKFMLECLAHEKWSNGNGSYGYYKKKCKVKDIIVKSIPKK